MEDISCISREDDDTFWIGGNFNWSCFGFICDRFSTTFWCIVRFFSSICIATRTNEHEQQKWNESFHHVDCPLSVGCMSCTLVYLCTDHVRLRHRFEKLLVILLDL